MALSKITTHRAGRQNPAERIRQMRRFYFTNDNADNVANDYVGNIRGARTYAQKYADARNETITINDFSSDEMVDFVSPNPVAVYPQQECQTMIKISEEEALTILAFVKNHEREEIPDDVWELCMRLYDEVC